MLLFKIKYRMNALSSFSKNEIAISLSYALFLPLIILPVNDK